MITFVCNVRYYNETAKHSTSSRSSINLCLPKERYMKLGLVSSEEVHKQTYRQIAKYVIKNAALQCKIHRG